MVDPVCSKPSVVDAKRNSSRAALGVQFVKSSTCNWSASWHVSEMRKFARTHTGGKWLQPEHGSTCDAVLAQHACRLHVWHHK
jgi:hypothetical protein